MSFEFILHFQIFCLIDSSSFRKPVLPLISILEYRRLTFQSQLTLPPFTCGFLALTSTICLSHPEFLLASCFLSVLHSTNLRLTIWSRLIFVGSINFTIFVRCEPYLQLKCTKQTLYFYLYSHPVNSGIKAFYGADIFRKGEKCYCQ